MIQSLTLQGNSKKFNNRKQVMMSPYQLDKNSKTIRSLLIYKKLDQDPVP